MTPSRINADLAVAFGGYKLPDHPDTKAYRERHKLTHSTYDHNLLSPGGVLASSYPDYFHSNALAIELLEKACVAHKLDNVITSSRAYISLKTDTWCCLLQRHHDGHEITHQASIVGMASAICLALHASGIELGLIEKEKE